MKKLFTFLMLAAFVAMGFAQQTIYVQDEGHYIGNVNMDRSSWIGNTTFRGLFTNQGTVGEDHAYYFIIKESDVNAGVQFDKVTFGHYISSSSSITNTAYTIYFYRNPVVTQSGSGYSLTSQGEEIDHWSYEAPNTEGFADLVEVNFPTPYTVVAGESYCVKVVLGGPHAFFALGPYCTSPEDLSWTNYFMDCGQGPAQYQFHPMDEAGNTYYPVALALAVHYNDGMPELQLVDIHPSLLDPEDDSYDEIFGDTLYVDPNGEALFARPIVRNQGMNDAVGTIISDLYMTSSNVTEPLYFWQNDTVVADTLAANTLIYWQNLLPLFLFDEETSEEYYTWTEIQELGFSLPFDLCMTSVYYPAPGYNGQDVNLTNDLYCLTIMDIADMPEPDGISENTNTLTVTPNPASTTLMVANAAGSQISVYNIAGQEVMSIANAEANETLNVSNLNAGLYIVRVVNGNEVSTAKVSIVR